METIVPGASGPDDNEDDDWLAELQRLLDLHRSGDPSTRSHLVEWVERWQQAKVRSELDGFAALRRWYQSGDVMNELLIKLDRELAKRQPATVAEFLGLVGLLIKHRLIDFWRSCFGPEGFAARHHSSAPKSDGSGGAADEGADDSPGPFPSAESAEMIVKLLEALERLPEDQKQVIQLKYFQELTLPEIARVMRIPLIRVNRLLARARLFLTKELGSAIQ